MKKALTQTIIVFVALNLLTSCLAFAQNAPDEASREESIAARIQAEVARRQMEATQKQMPATRQAITGYEMDEIMMVAPRVSIPVWQHSGSGAVLVIPAAQMKVEDLAAITADMSVMSRIFDKKLSQARLTTRGSWPIGFDPLAALGRSSGAIEAIYLEGYGALFLMRVNALLSPPPEAQQEKETEEDTDPLWTQTIQEMYATEEADRPRLRTARPEEKYDAEKVEDLKETLIKTLKHAANIRNLKPDESVILSVTGKAGQSATRTTTRSSYGRSIMISSTGRRGDRSSMVRRAPGVPTVAASLLPTVLTIRAKKADIDAFANGTLSFNQFSQKILLLSYSYLGGNISGGPSRSFPTNIVY